MMGPPPPYVLMTKSLIFPWKPQNQADKNLKYEVQYGNVYRTNPKSFMKFCSAFLEQQRIRDGPPTPYVFLSTDFLQQYPRCIHIDAVAFLMERFDARENLAAEGNKMTFTY